MLELLRAFAKTWIARILLAVLVVSFGAFGINNVVTQLGSSTIAHVGNEDISAQDFQRAYTNQLNAASQQLGKVPTAQEAMTMGIPGQVIGQLAANSAVNQYAQAMGIGASDAHVAKVIGNDPNFANAIGKFDQSAFTQVLQSNGFTEAQYVAEEVKASRREQLALGLFGDAPIPGVALEIANRYRADTRTLSYFALTDTTLPSIPTPTDADLAAYLKDHQADYRTKETRAIELMTLSPSVLAASITVPDDQIAAEYEKTKADLVKVEKRDIKQVSLTDDQAKAFQIGQAAGKTFDEMVTAAGLKATDLGAMTKDGLSDASLATAAFGLKVGEFAIIPGISGKRAVSVASIEPGGQISLAEAKPDIAKRLALQQATTEVGDDTDQIEDLHASKQPIASIASRFKLKVYPLDLTAGGSELSAVPEIGEADRQKVSDAVFAAKEGGITPTVQLSNSQNVWFDLKTITPARDQTIAEVKDAVTKAWTAQKTDELLKAEANKIIDELKSGKSFDDVAAENRQVPTLSQPITRQGNTKANGPDAAIDGTVAAAAFNGGPGYFSYAVNGYGDYVVFEVTAVTAATQALPDQIKTQVQTSIRDSMNGDFINGLREQYGLRTNQGALNQALSLDPNGN